MNKPRVLVVEDDPVSAGMIRQYLKADYHLVASVKSGEEAVLTAGQCRPDLALMDVGLAGDMDGIEAAGLIWERYGVPVIYLTSSSDRDTVSRAASTEAYGYLHKPVQSRELATAIEIALSKHEAECKLVETKNWFETTLRCIADAVIAADSLGMVKFINPAAESLTGWSQREAVGRDLSEVFRVMECGAAAPAECEVTDIIREGSASVSQTRILISRSGVQTLVAKSRSPITNERGDIVGVVLVFRPSCEHACLRVP